MVDLESLHRLIKLGWLGWFFCSLVYLASADTPGAFIPGKLARAPGGERVSELTPVCDLQGAGDVSPYDDQEVRTQGVVYADGETLGLKGFYMQHEGCDANPGTSDGIFVYTGSQLNTPQEGDLVEVRGVVQEYYGQTEILAAPDQLTILASANPLPSPIEINPPLDGLAAAYLESLEGMFVRMQSARVVGPSDAAGETFVVPAVTGIERVYDDDTLARAAIIAVSNQGEIRLSSPAKVADQLVNLQGALEGSVEIPRLHLLLYPLLEPGDLPVEAGAPSSSSGFTLATFNLANLFDSQDDPLTDDIVLSAAEYQRRLQKRALAIGDILAEPDILVLQEVENMAVLQALVNRPEIEADYKFVWEDSADQRGLDIALLYNPDRVELLDYQVRQGCTDLIDGLGPDGNGDVENPANGLTCDCSGDGIPDGNRLFSRPPLVVRVRIAVDSTRDTSRIGTIDLTVIANHWKSRLEDTIGNQYTLPRRMQQAQFTVRLVQELQEQRIDDYILVAGDLNDVSGSTPLAMLKAIGLRDLSQEIQKRGRYTLIYRGLSQVIDYVMEQPRTGLGAAQVRAMHINADFPAIFAGVDGTVYRSSDHDPVWVNVIKLSEVIHLPQIFTGE